MWALPLAVGIQYVFISTTRDSSESLVPAFEWWAEGREGAFVSFLGFRESAPPRPPLPVCSAEALSYTAVWFAH